MKNLAMPVLAIVSLGGAVGVLAQNPQKRPIFRPGGIKNLRLTPTLYKGKLSRATPTLTGKEIERGPRIGERFQLRVWAVVLPAMPTRSWCGNLKLNDQLRWSIPPSEAPTYHLGPGATIEISEDITHRQGGQFTVSAFYGNPSKTRIGFSLYSVESGQSVLRAAYQDRIDLLQQSGKTYKCTMGKGEAALYVKVERVGYVYGIRLPNPLPTPTPTPRYRPPGPHRG